MHRSFNISIPVSSLSWSTSPVSPCSGPGSPGGPWGFAPSCSLLVSSALPGPSIAISRTAVTRRAAPFSSSWRSWAGPPRRRARLVGRPSPPPPQAFGHGKRPPLGKLEGFYWSHVGWVLSKEYEEYDSNVVRDLNKYPRARLARQIYLHSADRRRRLLLLLRSALPRQRP